MFYILGWDDCAELIKIITSPDRISKQLVPTIKLAQRFQDVGCLEGVKLIGECLVSCVVNCLGSDNLNYDLLDHLLENSNNTIKLDKIIKQLSNESKTSLIFIDGFMLILLYSFTKSLDTGGL